MEHFRIENGVLLRYTGPGGDVTVPSGVTALGRAAFARREDITAVALPEGLVRVGSSAFSGCAALREIALPETVREIGSWAFCGCAALEEVALPAAVRRVEERTFWGCAALERVSLPEGLESIGPEAFRGCAALGEIALPGSVTALGEGAFQDCAALAAPALPPKLTVLSRRAFRGCRSMKKVNLLPGTERVEGEAFAFCAALREIVFPETVKEIAPSALAYGSALERITLLTPAPGTAFAPEGVPLIAPGISPAGSKRALELTLGYAAARREGVAYPAERQEEYTAYLRAEHAILAPMALTGCPGLLEALLDAEAIPPEEVDGLLPLCSSPEKRTALLSCRDRAEGGTDLWDELDLDLSLDPLSGEEADSRWDYEPNADGLTLTAWRGGEREIYVPNRIGDRAVTAVGDRAFSPRQPGLSPAESAARREIRGIFLPYGVRRIGDEAFRDCAALRELMLPERPESVGRSAFLGTPWWEALPEGCVYLGDILYRYKGAMAPGAAISVREGVRGIAPGAFRDREELGELRLPRSLEIIGPMAFYNCSLLRTVAFSAAPREIGEYAFHGCGALAEIALPEGVRALGDRAFYGCGHLRAVRLPGSLSAIGEGAFSRCGELVIRAPAGSCGEEYAKKHAIPFQAAGNGIEEGNRP